MISNMQHQQFDDAVMVKITPSKQSVVVDKYTNNNNNNNMNKNIHIITSAELLSSANQNPDVLIFDPSVDYYDINSSLDTKETITVAASQPLYENAPLIPAISIPAVTAIKSSTTTVVVNNAKRHIDNGAGGIIQPMLVNMNVQRDTPHQEYALKRSGCDWSPIKNQDRVLTVNNMDNQLESSRLQQRQQSHSDALRCIEDVHNYSKVNRYDDSPNCSSPEEDDEDDLDDIDDEYDDDVFGTTSKQTTNKNHGANSRSDSSANSSISHQSGKQSQLQLQSNVNNHHKDNLNLSFDDDVRSPTKNSPRLKGDTTNSSSASPKSSVNSPTTPTCDDGHDDMMGIGENFGGMNGDKSAPDHHARRPMNAFLIFCKRHRAIVRDKYKNLENRQITKILGEWWATLSNIEKGCYTDLAKQYKDAFFKANPNFKWYKLPAPPLRTCTIRPGHHSPTSPIASNNYYLADYNYNNNTPSMMNGANDDGVDRFNCDNGYVRKSSTSTNNHSENIYSDTSNNRNRSNSNSSNSFHHTNKSAVGVFKFADEAQMGGLSSLMCASNGSSSSNSPIGIGNAQSDNAFSLNTKDNNAGTRMDHHRQDALQNALSETSEFLSATMPERKNDMEPFQNMRSHALHMESNQVLNGKRKGADDPVAWSIKKKPYSPTDGVEFDMSPRKASRSCKGKRYQELMISGQIVSSSKKANPKVKSIAVNGMTNGYCKGFESLQDNGDHSSMYHDQTSPRQFKADKVEIIIPEQADNIAHYANHPQPESPNTQKQFDASDFDLEEKIKALPAQCLESYLVRKRETKKKKKIGSKRRTTTSTSSSSFALKPQQLQRQLSQRQVEHRQSPPKTIQEARERMQSAMVGSQKRKARKESITRRDVNAMCSSSGEMRSPTANCLFDAVGLAKLNDAIKVEYDPDNCHYEDQVVDGLMTIIKEETESMPNACNHPNSTPTSDLLILAEVATNHIEEEVYN